MKTLQIDFESHRKKCHADVVLAGISDSWVAEVNVVGHPSISHLRINYRLGDFFTPMFISKDHRDFFAPLFDKIANEAKALLPETFPEHGE